MNQNVLIRNSKLKIANGNHSTLNILALASGTADYNIQHCASRIILHRQSRQFNNQHSKLKNAKSAIKSFYDEQGNDSEMVVMKVGNDTF